MPIHFSIGFVVEASPKSPWVSVCSNVSDSFLTAVIAGDVNVDSSVGGDMELTACWPRENGSECNGGV